MRSSAKTCIAVTFDDSATTGIFISFNGNPIHGDRFQEMVWYSGLAEQRCKI